MALQKFEKGGTGCLHRSFCSLALQVLQIQELGPNREQAEERCLPSQLHSYFFKSLWAKSSLTHKKQEGLRKYKCQIAPAKTQNTAWTLVEDLYLTCDRCSECELRKTWNLAFVCLHHELPKLIWQDTYTTNSKPQNHLGHKRTLRSSATTINLTLPRPSMEMDSVSTSYWFFSVSILKPLKATQCSWCLIMAEPQAQAN